MSTGMRRQHWVDSDVQGKLVKRILFHWCAFFVVTLLCFSAMNAMLGNPERPLFERITSPGSGMILLGIIMLSMFPAFALDTIRFSNRFVGPIVRLRRGLRELGDHGPVSELNFRDNDFWSDVADEFNSAVRRIERQEREIAALRDELSSSKAAVRS
jgi:hypothetical protein